MPVAISTGGGGNQRESTLDKILKGLSLAKAGFGIAVDVDSLRRGALDRDIKNEQLTAAQRENRGEMTQAQAVKAGFRPSPLMPPSEGNIGAPPPRFSKRSEVEIPIIGDGGEITRQKFVSGDEEKTLIEREANLRDKWYSNPTTRRSAEMTEALGRMRELVRNPGKLGPAQIGVLYSYMKLIDPGSTVREGEFSTAESAGGWAKAAGNLWNRLNTGQRIDKDVVREFMSAANHLVGGQLKTQGTIDEQFKTLAKEEGFREELVVPPIFKGIQEAAKDLQKDGDKKKSELSGEDKQALEWAKANPNDPRSAQIRQRLGR